MTLEQAKLYNAPFEYVEKTLKPIRAKNRERQRRENWWRLGRSGTDYREASKYVFRQIFTPRVAKHRVFVWVERNVFPDSAVVAIRPRRRLLLRSPALQTARSLVAAHGHLARQRQRSPLHADHHIPDLSLPLVARQRRHRPIPPTLGSAVLRSNCTKNVAPGRTPTPRPPPPK